MSYDILTERLLSLFGWKLSILVEKLRKGQRSATRARAAAAAGWAMGVGAGTGRAEAEAEAMAWQAGRR